MATHKLALVFLLVVATVALPRPCGGQSKAHKELLSELAVDFQRGSEPRPMSAPRDRIDDALPGNDRALTDSQILYVARVASAGEVMHARLAARRSHDRRVQRLARTMLREHAAAERRAERYAQARRLHLVPAPQGVELQSNAAKVLRELDARESADFDRAFLASQIDAHRRVLSLIDDELLPHATNPDVATLVRALRPTVQASLDTEIVLAAKLDAP